MLVARHPNRPTVLDYVSRLFTDFIEISGDRRFADDHAIVTGFARYKDEPVLVVGHHKGGGDTKQKIYRNFGYAKPEGYRKALRAMKLAEKYRRAGDRVHRHAGRVSRASSRRSAASPRRSRVNLREMAALDTPIIVVVHGEGGSGGALGLAVGDRILMHEFAIYSVIPPEGCAAILWRDSGRKVEAAEALKLTAPDLLRLGLVDEIVPEPARRRRTPTTTWRPRCSTRRWAAHCRRCRRWSLRRACEARYAEVANDGERRDRRELIQRLWQPAAVRRRAGRRQLVAGAGRRRRSRRGCCASAASRDLDQARRFLSPSLDDLLDPFALTDMPVAVDRILAAIASKERIADPRRLRRGRRHVDGHSAPRARTARRRRHPFHPGAPARRVWTAAGVARSPAPPRTCVWSSRSTAASAASRRPLTPGRSASI